MLHTKRMHRQYIALCAVSGGLQAIRMREPMRYEQSAMVGTDGTMAFPHICRAEGSQVKRVVVGVRSGIQNDEIHRAISLVVLNGE